MRETGLDAFYPKLARLGHEERLDAGAVLWKEGDPGDSVAFLREGTLEVVNEAAEAEEVVLRILEAGTVVGEISTDGSNRSATVRAHTPCLILKVPAPAFRQFARQEPEFLERLFWTQVDRVRSLTREVARTHRRAITDELTRLYNHGFFRRRLEIEIDRARETGDQLSLVLFDIDLFKNYNDTYGHEEGNEVLVDVARIMKGIGRRADIIARYGGEEFVALLYGASGEEAHTFAETVRRAVETHPFAEAPGREARRVTISGGCATFPQPAGSEDELIKIADERLYQAKAQGRNRVVA
ncbi:MAG TPA: GGDEF domain-containing protein [Vicinamibacteria bacterium]|nr:GGDEF domain-containing protein [Vicinamibacteria bacterium]